MYVYISCIGNTQSHMLTLTHWHIHILIYPWSIQLSLSLSLPLSVSLSVSLSRLWFLYMNYDIYKQEQYHRLCWCWALHQARLWCLWTAGPMLSITCATSKTGTRVSSRRQSELCVWNVMGVNMIIELTVQQHIICSYSCLFLITADSISLSTLLPICESNFSQTMKLFVLTGVCIVSCDLQESWLEYFCVWSDTTMLSDGYVL